MSQKKQGFVHGALILMLAGIVVKVVGALFKIPLSNIIGDTAMGYFNTAYSVYSMCFLISTAGLPVAISRMIAASRAEGRTREVERIYKISLGIFTLIGLLGTAFLFFAAEKIAAIPSEPELTVCLRAISPIMFFICLVACIRGYFQGHQNMIPTAVSQIIEVLGKLLLGLSAALLATKKNLSPALVAAWALGGITVGVVLSALFMTVSKTLSTKKNPAEEAGETRGRRSLASELIGIAVPITISSSILSLTSVIDSMLAVRRLNDALVGVHYFAVDAAVPVAVTLIGAYIAKSVTLFNLTPTLITPFAISIIPAISGAKKEDGSGMEKTVDFTFRMVSAICLPAAFGIGIMAKPIIDLLFTSDHPIFYTENQIAASSNHLAAQMLSLLAAAILFSGLVSVSSAVLQARGFENKSIISTCFGVLAKACAVWFLVGNPKVGLYGIPLSTLICYLVMFACNMYFLAKHLNYRPAFGKMLVKPGIAAALCGVCAILGYKLLSVPFSEKIATLGAIAAAAVVYTILIFLLRTFDEEDILRLPKGEKILGILKKIRLIAK